MKMIPISNYFLVSLHNFIFTRRSPTLQFWEDPEST